MKGLEKRIEDLEARDAGPMTIAMVHCDGKTEQEVETEIERARQEHGRDVIIFEITRGGGKDEDQ